MLKMTTRRTILMAVLACAAAVYASFCAFQLTRMTFSISLDSPVANSPAYARMALANTSIPQPDPIVLCMPCDGPLYSEAAINELVRFTETLGLRGEALGARGWTLRSIMTESIPRVEEGSVSFAKLQEAQDRPGAVEAAVRGMPTLRSLFCPSGDAWVVYAYPAAANDIVALRELDKALGAFPSVLAAGGDWIKYQSHLALRRDLLLVLPLSLLLFALFFLIVERAGAHSLLLLAGIILPALGTFALFPLFGQPLKVITILAPILVLSLSTTYVLHVYHHYSEGKKTYRSFFAERGNVLFWSSITTLLGFGSLLFSSLADLRINGAFIICGMFLALFWDLLVLPVCMAERDLKPKKPRIDIFGDTGPAGAKKSKARSWINLARIAMLCLYAVCVPGLLLIKPGMNLATGAFMPSFPYSAKLKEFSRRYPAEFDIRLYVDSGREGGIIDPVFYSGLRTAAASIAAFEFSGGVQTYADIVDETGRLLGYGNAGEDERKIGEILEILPVDPDSPRLYDLSYRTAILRIQLKPGSLIGFKESEKAIAQSKAAVERFLPGAAVSVAGSMPLQLLFFKIQIDGQVLSLAIYFAVVFALVLLRLRSLKKAALICAGPLLAILASLGICGYLGWPFSLCLSLAMAMLAGVGIDDAFIWCFFSHKPSMRRSVLGTALLLAFGLSPLLLSAYSDLMRAVVAVIIGFAFSTSYVLKVLPWKKSAQTP
jgi:predicted RND superfamily exporter protein